MPTLIKEQSLDWALAHACRYSDSDHFARIFEFSAIQANWKEVKAFLLSIDLDSYAPQHPLIRFAPRLNGTNRVVHRLDPLDTLIYTALVHQIHEAAEGPRGPDPMRTNVSRVCASEDGSFFKAARNAWQKHLETLEILAGKFKGGCVLMADIFDFFGQIQPRLLSNVLEETRSIPHGPSQALSRFLLALSPATHRGIPVGPAASSVLAESVGASIDREIARHTHDYVRWVDDLYLFFNSRQEAHDAMRSLSDRIDAAHQLVFSPEKTRIVTVEEYLATHHKGLAEETVAAGIGEERLGQLAGKWRPTGYYYGWSTAAARDAIPRNLCVQLQSLAEYRQVGEVYASHFSRAIRSSPPDLMSARRILRKAAGYRIRGLLPEVLEHFESLMPVIRETAIYLKAVLDAKEIQNYAGPLKKAWESKQLGASYVNEWMCHAFSHPGFNQIDIPPDYNCVLGIRNQALLALRKRDTDWIRKQAAYMDVLDPWSMRAVLYACSALPRSEAATLTDRAKTRGAILERSVALHALAACDRASRATSAGARVSGPDNYPSYGDKPAAAIPDNMKLMEEIETQTLQLADQARAIRELQTGLAEKGAALDHQKAEIKLLDARLASLEQLLDRLSNKQAAQAK